VKLDNLRFEIIYIYIYIFLFIVLASCQNFVSECKTKRNKTGVLWEDIELPAGGVMENEKKLRYAAALLALNPSASFCQIQKARKELGIVKSNVSCKQAL